MIDAVAIGLFHHERPAAVTVRAPGPWTLRGPAGAFRIRAGAPVAFSAAPGGVAAAWPGGAASAPRWRLAGTAPWRIDGAHGAILATRTVRGEVQVGREGAAIVPVARVPLEAYVAAVTTEEMPAGWPMAALAAQAIAARSFTAVRRREAGHPGFELCDATHCQRFRGAADARAVAAADATRGRVLLAGGRPAEATWHAACGGARADAADAFGRSTPPYLAGGPDRRPDGRAWCADDPHAGPWAVAPTAAALTALLRRAGRLGPDERLRGLSVAAAGPWGHVRSVRVVGDRPREVPGWRFWAEVGPGLGWRGLRSLAFTIAPTPEGWRFAGRGLGHGVGMCQAGARARAEAGWSVERILAAYYPGAVVGR